MPFVSWDLGFPSLIPLILFLFPIFLLLVSGKWSIAAAGKEEIIRLVVHAAEEATRIELEAAVEYGGGSKQPQCAVCYLPTTTRCSRCKAVRYCSGKCQIIHWRQGHREECCPPSTVGQMNESKSESDSNMIFQDRHLELKGDSLESEGGFHAKPSSVPGRKDDLEVTMGTDPLSFSSSTGCYASTMVMEPLFHISVIEDPVSTPPIISGGASSDDITGDVSTVDVSENNIQCDRSSDELTGQRAPVNSRPYSFKLKQKKPNGCTRNACSRSCGFPASNVDGSDESTIVRQSTTPCRSLASTVEDSGTQFTDHKGLAQSRLRKCSPSIHSDFVTEDLRSLGSARSSSVAKERINVEQPLRSRGLRSSSSSVSTNHPDTDDGHSSSYVTSSEVDTIDVVPGSSETAISLLSSRNGLKTSMRKVIQQFRPSKLSKHCQLGLESVAVRKCKILFPFDLFAELYIWDNFELHPYGLINCGNSCYANAVLQCLAFTPPLTAYLLQGLHTNTCPKTGWCFTCEFESLVLRGREKSPISPIAILSQIQSIGTHLGYGTQEDAHEFLRYAIDTMQSVCLKEAGVYASVPFAEETTLIRLTFGGYLRSKIKCMKCHGKSEQNERMLDLNVEIHGNISTLEEALAQFTATEILDEENKYHCGRCKSYAKAKKKLTVLEAPNVLTIALKRFQSGKFGKLNKSVRFPEVLDLAPYMDGTSDKSPIYRLYAVVVHLDVMKSAFSGHYVCYVKNIHGNWFKIDDSKVKPVELERVLSKGAYMLLYSRCSPRAPSLIRNIRNRCMEDIPSSHSAKASRKGRRVSSVSNGGPPEALGRLEDYAHWTTWGGSKGRLFPMYRIPKMDSSSDNSSLFSCSDEGSCSTESSGDSTSTEEYSGYLFGDSRLFTWNSSPLRFSDDSNVSSSSSLFRQQLGAENSHYGYSDFDFSSSWQGHNTCENGMNTVEVEGGMWWGQLQQDRGEGWEGKEMPPFLYSDITSEQCRELTDYGSIISETDLGWANPYDGMPGVALRKPWETTAQTFY